MDQTVRERINLFLRSKNLRRTSQRDAIVEAAFGTHEHFTAEELLRMARDRDGAVSRATVYRTLPLLVESGLLREVDLGRNETVYDPNFIDHPNHNHLICVDCQKIVEFEDEHINVLEDCISRRLGFSPSSKSIRIEASCDRLHNSGTCVNQPKSTRSTRKTKPTRTK